MQLMRKGEGKEIPGTSLHLYNTAQGVDNRELKTSSGVKDYFKWS
jgi:hypothetical protein